MVKVGFIGWRGMVGSVLLSRMMEEGDFRLIEPVFFSTSQVGQISPDIGQSTDKLHDANSLEELESMDIILSCQGSAFTENIHPQLRKTGWKGYWIDASSSLRKSNSSIIILDPVNLSRIEHAIKIGVKDFVGGNCTVSLMLMAINGLFCEKLIDWVSSMTYQAASGAGASSMEELVTQMFQIGKFTNIDFSKLPSAILGLDKQVTQFMNGNKIAKENFGYPLAGNVLPYIDSELSNGQSREEWKNQFETNKILGTTDKPIPLDGICVRVGSMRCHSQALTIKLNKSVAINEIENLIENSNPWVKLVPNTREHSLSELTPSAVAGKLDIPVGRLRKMNMGEQYLSVFTSGDQLLWGASEPLRRMLKIIVQKGY
mgnify:FL=1